MATRLNRYYNNPQIGAAISNLASIFEPPAPADVLAYAQAEKTRREMGGLENLYKMAGDPNADPAALDRWGAVTGQWNPNQGFGARDMANSATLRGQDINSADQRYGINTQAATARRGQDITADTSRYGTNAGLVSDLFGPLNQGQVRPQLPQNVADMFDMPGLPAAEGLPKPLSATEVEGAILGDAYAENPDAMRTGAANRIAGDFNVEQIVGEGGAPQIVPRGEAVGQEPYVNPGTKAAMQFKTWAGPSGQGGIAKLDPSAGTIVDSATGAPLPQGAILGDVVDTMEGMTTAVTSDVQRDARSAIGFLSTVDQLTNLVQSAPASQGIVGALRGTAQNVMQTGGELGQFFGGTTAEVSQAVNAGLIDAGLAAQMFDPSLPAIEMLTNVLAWQYAKSFAGDRVSNEQLRQAKAAIGGGSMFSNQADTLTRLGQLRSQFTMQLERDKALMPPELQAQVQPYLGGGAPAPAAAPAAQMAPAGPPAVGAIEDGFVFMGGDPANPASWRPAGAGPR